jgi:hypothetical protein
MSSNIKTIRPEFMTPFPSNPRKPKNNNILTFNQLQTATEGAISDFRGQLLLLFETMCFENAVEQLINKSRK